MALTNIAVRNAKTGEKPRKIYDSGGLYLIVRPSGGKWWRQKFRFRGKEKLLSLGVFPSVSLKEARELRDENRKLLSKGIDPSAQRKAEKVAGAAAETFESVAIEWYSTNKSAWAPSHQVTILGRLRNNIFPYLGDTSIGEIEAKDLLDALRRIERRGAHETAHRVLGICNQVWLYAIATRRIEHNVAANLKGALAPAEKGVLAALTEPAEVGELLQLLGSYKGTLVVKCALKLSPHLFVRPGELRTARWEDIDFEKKEWVFTTSKRHTPLIVPLSTQAIEILEEIRPLTGRQTFVFPSARAPSRPMSNGAILAALRSLGIPKERMSGHGVRAMARTMLDEQLGVRVDFVEHQLGHAVKDPMGRSYNRTTFLAERREMMQKWSDYLDTLLSDQIMTYTGVFTQFG